MLYTIYMEAISFTQHKKLLLPEESRNRIERIFHIAQEKKAGQTDGILFFGGWGKNTSHSGKGMGCQS